MDVQRSAERFNEAISALPDPIRKPLDGIPRNIKEQISEIRLRVGSPIALTGAGQCWFVDRSSQLHNIARHCFRISAEDLAQAVVSMCAWSLHSHQEEFLGGYISLRGGHRAGICGSAVLENGQITAVRDITSVNLRIAREVRGAASGITRELFQKGLQSALIVGAPGTGKTTILRDLARQLSNGEATGRPLRVAVVDERGEIGAVFQGSPQNDLGPCCDILNGYPKGEGILTAVRTLSPQVIICDEIGSKQDVDGILDGLNCGVKVIASAHAATLEELLSRRQIVRLIRSGGFENLVRLGRSENPGMVEDIVNIKEWQNEAAWYAAHRPMHSDDRELLSVRPVHQGAKG